MSMALDVIFERKDNDSWTPVPSAELKPGDVARMKTIDGKVLRDEIGEEQYQVSGTNGIDPDSNTSFDVCLCPCPME